MRDNANSALRHWSGYPGTKGSCAWQSLARAEASLVDPDEAPDQGRARDLANLKTF
jgi:hypothetical protein